MSASEQGGPSAPRGAEASREPEEIREDIARTREELGDTVAAMAAKTDVKQQAQAKAGELKDQAGANAKELSEKAREVAPESATEGVQQAQQLAKENPMPLALAGAFLTGLIFGRLLSRRTAASHRRHTASGQPRRRTGAGRTMRAATTGPRAPRPIPAPSPRSSAPRRSSWRTTSPIGPPR
jgi:ElaB/YqjD/DUF883 family membrane-anchored ribosome-binding protein